MSNLAIPRREIWTQQPMGVPRVHHPAFSRKGSYVYAPWVNPSAVFMLGGAKLPMTTRGGPTTRATSAGLAGEFVASNGDCITNQGFSQGLSLPTITIAIASTGAITGAIRSIIGRSSYGNRYTGIRAGSASNTWEYQYYGSVSSVVLTGTSSFSDDEMCVIVGVSYSATDHELYVNGKLEATSTTNGGADPGLDSLVVGCANDSRTWDLRANGLVVLGLIGQGVLSRPSVRQLAENPWQVFESRETRLFVPVGGGGSVNANASGALSAVSVAAPSASASGGASATGACAAITLSAPTATASAGGSASASGSFSALSISPATATATATTSATASGAFATISLSAPNATATGTTAGNAIATATPAQITISHATAIAIGSAVASGGYQSIGITAPTGSASVGIGNATASGALSAISITAPAAYASSGFIRAPSGSGPTAIQPGSYRPINTGGRRY